MEPGMISFLGHAAYLQLAAVIFGAPLSLPNDAISSMKGILKHNYHPNGWIGVYNSPNTNSIVKYVHVFPSFYMST